MDKEIKKHLTTLELDKVLKMLANETACGDAAHAALSVSPASSEGEAERMLAETDEAFVLLAKYGSPPFGGLENIINELRRADAGAMLTMAELLKVSAVLRTLRALSEWHEKNGEGQSGLGGLFNLLMPNKYLEDRINDAVLSEEEMSDTASPRLSDIRRRARSAMARAREIPDRIIRSASYQKYLQEPIVTIRNGRFVVPVKAEYRGEVKGLVHDTSSSGSTVFIEPMGAVEANNAVKILKSEEKKEIERILFELSGEVAKFAGGTEQGYKTAVKLNVVFAKASLAYSMKATRPKLNSDGRILLHNARHPLIDKDKVVPTDIELGTSFDTLVITGPNTGGKTVTLKTIGLFTLMAMCGLFIPADENSEVSVFGKVLADIGDEQSIEQSLSTFSAHMKNIINIISEADEKSLVLLDELGAGTDPVEGAALATVILEELRGKGAKIAATTHYAELKVYALQTKGVENAGCEFDVETLRPTYRLLIGTPGRSNAFAISRRLGMDSGIVERAKELVSGENIRFENVVQSLEESRRGLEAERTAAERARAAASEAEKRASQREQRINSEAERQMAEAKEKAAGLIARTRAQINYLLNEMDEIKKHKDSGITAEQKAKLKNGIRALEDTADPVEKREKGRYVLPRPLQKGDTVLIFDIDKKGVVLEPPCGSSKEVLVQAGIIQTRVPVSNLRLIKEKKVSFGGGKGRVTKDVSGPAGARASTELDLRGQTAGEALMEVDRFIDSALLLGIDRLTIIHGKGTGALRSAVQKHLKNHPCVKSYRLGTFGEGESGVTIVELK